MDIYLDTSCLVAFYVPETFSKKLYNLIEKEQPSLLLSNLAITEFHSAMSKKKRAKELSLSTIKLITQLFDTHIDEQIYQQVHVTDAVFKQAIRFLSSYRANLRTLDALHLASSQLLEATLLTSDKHLAQSAKTFKLPYLHID